MIPNLVSLYTMEDQNTAHRENTLWWPGKKVDLQAKDRDFERSQHSKHLEAFTLQNCEIKRLMFMPVTCNMQW